MAAGAAETNITKIQSLLVFGASAIGAVATLLSTVMIKHTLSGAELTEFLLFWSMLFALYALPAGINPEVTRAVGAQLSKSSEEVADNAPILRIAIIFGVASAGFTAISAVFWGASQLPTHTTLTVAILCASLLLYSVQTMMYGASAGRGRWSQYAALLASEPLLRLFLMASVILSSVNLANMELAAALPVAVWIIFILCSKDARVTLNARADTTTKHLIKNTLLTTATAVFSTSLITALPNILKASEGQNLSPSQNAKLAVLILAVLICRAPIMFPLGAITSIAIKTFLTQRSRLFSALRKPVLMLCSTGLIGAALAWFLGPFLFRIIYPPNPEELEAYNAIANGGVLAALVFAGVLTATLTITGTAALAIGKHAINLAGWATATLMTIIIVLLPFELIFRTILSLYIGPLLGSLCHIVLLKFALKKPVKQLAAR